MTQEQKHLIAPPKEMLKQWEDDWFEEREHADVLLVNAYAAGALAGADQELEACCALLEVSDKRVSIFVSNARDFLQSTRRPKPPSLKEQALQARAALAQPERQKLSDLRARVETLEAAAHRHIVETKANILALATRVNALELELAERRLSKALDISDLPQLTPEQVQNLQDLLGTYRNHLGLNN